VGSRACSSALRRCSPTHGFGHLDAFIPVLLCGPSAKTNIARYDPHPITGWNAIKEASWDSLDAVIVDPSNKNLLWFFHGECCIKAKLDSKTVTVDSLVLGPVRIVDQWNCLKVAMFNSVDYAVPDRTNANQVFVFKGPMHVCVGASSYLRKSHNFG